VKTKPEIPVEELYAKAEQLMQRKNFKSAASTFEKVQEYYPYTTLATQSQIMEAYCRYQSHKYEDAIDLFTIFIKLHPHNKDIPYAHYMIGLSHYERIVTVERDQRATIAALAAFQTVLTLYPTSDYAKDAKFKIDFIHNHLAKQEVSIGKFYQKAKFYNAAIQRYKTVLKLYPTTEQRKDALLEMLNCYVKLDSKREFLETYEILKKNHDDPVLLKKAQHLYDTYILNSKKVQDRKKA
jgi:outer membrane protein assembly factor BamD